MEIFAEKKFGTLLDIIPICDDIIKLKALCIECKKVKHYLHIDLLTTKSKPL